MAKKLITAIISGALFAGLIFMLRTYDVQAVGPNGTSIGFSGINSAFHNMTGVHMMWYDITDVLGFLALAVCGLFALTGLIQIIRRRSLFKVDKTIYALGALYIVVIGCYVFFEKCIINYRPVIMPGETMPEASFPSSHTMLILTVMISTIMVTDRYIRSRGLRTIVNILCTAIAVVTVLGRLYCGVHWLTDIIGGILLSITILELFSILLGAAKRADEDSEEIEAGTRGTANGKRTVISDDGYIPKH